MQHIILAGVCGWFRSGAAAGYLIFGAGLDVRRRCFLRAGAFLRHRFLLFLRFGGVFFRVFRARSGHDPGEQGVEGGPGAPRLEGEVVPQALFKRPQQGRAHGIVIGVLDLITHVAPAQILQGGDQGS